MRSRLWSLILRELPFPFRDIGAEVVRLLTWIDKTAARIWFGFGRSPAWYLVTIAGSVAFVLTALLFSTFVSSHDPTLGELADRSKVIGPATRESLEEAGDWATQDKWRLAHLFVSHSPKKHPVRPIDRVVPDDIREVTQVSIRREARPRSGFNTRLEPAERRQPVATLRLPDPEVQLDLGPPRSAEQPKRLVYGQYVREPGMDFHPVRPAANYRSRDSRLLVQAEWSSATECDSALTRQPTRRIIPVPDPQWDELPIPEPEDDRHPDLSFHMAMLREFLPAAGEFPPRSRTTSVSAASAFPESLDRREHSPSFAGDFPRWTRSGNDHAEPHRRQDSYVDRRNAEDRLNGVDNQGPVHSPDLHLKSAPSFAELALRLELKEPHSTVVGHSNQSSLVLHNDGLQQIPLITIRESLAGLKTVTDAIPPARVVADRHAEEAFDPEGRFEEPKALERHVEGLEPGKNRKLELAWRPDSAGRRTHSAMVTVTAAVGATTEIVPPVADQPMPSVAPEPIPVREPPTDFQPMIEPEPEAVPDQEPVLDKHPGLSFDVQHQPRASVDELVEVSIVVRNTGDVPLHSVRVIAQLPEQLKHRQGSEVEYTINRIPVSGSERAILRVVAESSGRAVCLVHVASQESVEADSKSVINVDAKTIRPEPPKLSRVEPAPPKLNPPAPKRVTPMPVSSNCCCQMQPSMVLEPWYLP